MRTFTVVITAIDPGRAQDVTDVVPLAMVLSTPLPIAAARDLPEAEAESLFHALRQAGAQVRLDAVDRPSNAPPGTSQRPSSIHPSSRPPSKRPSSSPSASPASSLSAPSLSAPAHDESFLMRGLRGYLYPVQPSVAPAIAMTLGLAFAIEFITSFVPIVNIVGSLVSLGLQVIFLSAVLTHASNGEDGPPRPAEAEDLWSLMGPAIHVILTLAVPVVLLLALAASLGAGISAFDPSYDAPFHPAVTVALISWLVYLPVSLILVAHGGHWLSGLNVIHGARLIARIPGGYLVACALLIAGIIAFRGILFVLGPMLQGMALGQLLLSALMFLLAVAGARILGLLLHHYEDELGG